MKPKIAIIVPLIAPEVVKDWGYIQSCLNRTLHSVLKCNSVTLRIFVVCQSEPELMVEDPRICFVESKNAIPQDRTAQGNDKAAKLAEGMLAASEFDPDYVMSVDADDLVSKELFDYVVNEPGYDAYCVEIGYEWVDGSGKLTLRDHFHRFCGTSFILRYAVELFPVYLGRQTGVEPVCEQSHTCRAKVLLAKNFEVYFIIEPRVIYVAGGRDQLMDRKKRLRRRLKDAVYSLWRDKKLSQDLRDEFSI
jgi:hypothetical protein